MDSRSRRNVLLGATVTVALFLATVLTIGLGSLFIFLVGFPAGVVVGAVSHEYAPAIRDGLFAGGLGSIVLAVLVVLVGFNQSLAMGFGFDSLVSFGGVVVAIMGLVGIGLAITVECCLAALIVHEIRLRRGAWAEG